MRKKESTTYRQNAFKGGGCGWNAREVAEEMGLEINEVKCVIKRLKESE